jgi:hypothetical protein
MLNVRVGDGKRYQGHSPLNIYLRMLSNKESEMQNVKVWEKVNCYRT